MAISLFGIGMQNRQFILILAATIMLAGVVVIYLVQKKRAT